VGPPTQAWKHAGKQGIERSFVASSNPVKEVDRFFWRRGPILRPVEQRKGFVFHGY